MKNFFIVFFFLFLSPILLHSQNNSLKVEVGREYENEGSKYGFVSEILRVEDGNILIIRKYQHGLFILNKIDLSIEKYAPNLQKIYSKEFTIANTGGNATDYQGCFTLGERPFVLSNYYNSSKKQKYLLVSEISNDGQATVHRPIGTVNTNAKEDGYFDVVFSADSSKIMVVEHHRLLRDELIEFTYTVFDRNFQPLWKSKVKLNHQKKDVDGFEYLLDNALRICILPIFQNSRLPEDKISNVMYIFEKDVAAFKTINFGVADKFIRDVKLMQNGTGDVLFFGLYSCVDKAGSFFSKQNRSILGTCIFTINLRDGSVISKSLRQFSRKIFDYYDISEKEVAKENGIDYLAIKKCLFDSKKGKYVVHLKNEVTEITVTKQSRRAMSDSKPAIILEFEPNYKAIEEGLVPMRVHCPLEFGHRHVLAYVRNVPLYIYNADIGNLGKKIAGIRDIEFTSLIGLGAERDIFYYFSNGGDDRMGQLLKNNPDKYFIKTDHVLQYDENSIVFVACIFASSRYKLIKVSLN